MVVEFKVFISDISIDVVYVQQMLKCLKEWTYFFASCDLDENMPEAS